MSSRSDNKMLTDIKIYLQQKYNCHTLILYGSRSRNEFNSISDYDIIAIRKKGKYEKDCRVFKGFYLDAFIYSEGAIKNPDLSLIRIKNGIVLCQKNSIGTDLLNKIQRIIEQGPMKTPTWERQEISIWLTKMLDRAKQNNIEGNFRRNWLLHDLLEYYFKLRDMWYFGPKESFAWLKKHDLKVYLAYDEALQLNADIDTIENLIKHVINKK